MAGQHTRIVDRAFTRLKLKQLRLLIAIDKHRSIQNAARELGVSQPAATKMVKELELDFEVPLLERSNRGVLPTPYGEALIRHGKLIFAHISNAAQEMDDLAQGAQGRVVVGTLLAASSHLLPMAIEEVMRASPKAAIKVVEGTNEVLIPALRVGEIDLVVGRLPIHRYRQEIEQLALFEEKIIAVTGCDHPLAGQAGLGFDALKGYGWILPPLETTLRRQIDQYFISQDQYDPPLVVESVSFLTNRALLQNNDYIGLMPAHVAAQDLASGYLAKLSWAPPFGSGPVGVSYRSVGEISPVGQALLDALQDVAKAI